MPETINHEAEELDVDVEEEEFDDLDNEIPSFDESLTALQNFEAIYGDDVEEFVDQIQSPGAYDDSLHVLNALVVQIQEAHDV